MKQEIPIKAFLYDLAEFTLDISLAISGDEKSKKRLKDLENLDIKFDRKEKIELLAAEIFIIQIPISLFLQNKGVISLLDDYYLHLYQLLKKKYKFFKDSKELENFEVLLQKRYEKYHALATSNEFYTREVARRLARIINNEGLVIMALTGLFTNHVVVINTFIKEVSEKFTLTI